MPRTDDDLKILGEEMIRVASERGAVFCGFIFRLEPPLIMGLSNTKESGAALAIVYRRFADMLEDSDTAGRVTKVPVLPAC